MNTKKEDILTAARKRFKNWPIENNKITVIFEHEQWWITFFDEIEEVERVFSVCDAEGVGVVDGFDFEEV